MQLASARDPLDPSAFVPVVQRCGVAQPMAVRVLAAKALAPLIPASELPAVAAALAAAVADALCPDGGLAAGLAGLAVGPGGGSAAAGRSPAPRPAANSVHGWLLQLHALLGPDSAGGAAPAALLDALAPPLARCVALCSPGAGRWGCAPLAYDYLRTLGALAALPGALDHPATAALLREASLRCWAAIAGSAEAGSPEGGDPMASPAYKQATQLYFGRLLPLRYAAEGSPPGAGLSWERLGPDLALALLSRRSEVRAAALKVACQRLTRQQQQQEQQGCPAQAAVEEAQQLAGLRPVLGQLLLGERFHTAQRRAFQHLNLLPPAPAAGDGGSLQGPPDPLFALALSVCRGTAEPATRGHALVFAGSLLRPRLLRGCSSGGGEAAEVLPAVRVCVAPWECPELRLAAVQALHSSGEAHALPCFLVATCSRALPKCQAHLPGWGTLHHTH